jgi:hypothetical protein
LYTSGHYIPGATLAPLLYTLAAEAFATAIAPMHPLYYDYPEYAEAYSYARCTFSDRNLHSSMPLVPTPAEAGKRVTNDIPLGYPLFLPVHTVNCVQTEGLRVHGGE